MKFKLELQKKKKKKLKLVLRIPQNSVNYKQPKREILNFPLSILIFQYKIRYF